MLKKARARRWRSPALLVPVLAAATLGGSYAAASLVTADSVPRGTTVADLSIGSAGRGRAEELVDDAFAPLREAPVPVAADGTTGELASPAAAGLALDVPATVDRAVGAPWSPAKLWRHVAGGGPVQPVSDVDRPALEAAVADLSGRVGQQAVEGGVSFEGGVATPVEPRAGRALDEDAAVDLLAAHWVDGPRPLQLPTVADEPEVDADDVQAALTGFALPALAAPLAVTVADRTVELPPSAVAPLLSTVPEDGELVGRVDGEGLVAAVLAADPEAVTAPRDARIEIADGAPRVVPGVAGTSIDAAALAQAAAEALTEPAGAPRVVVAEVAQTEPELTTTEAEALGVVELVSEFSTTLTPDAPRTENITIGAREVDGTLLLPGETFSLNGVLGERTPAKGYNQAGVISGGKLTKDYGGGVSQLATTLFNGMFFAGLDDVEHKAHSLYFSRYPEGREATVAWPSVDLRFTNDAKTAVLIETWVAGGQVHTQFWGTKVYDVEATKGPRRNIRTPETRVETGPDCTPQAPITGFDVTVTRTFRQAGAVVRTERFDTTYNALDAVTCEAPPEAAPPPPPVDPQAAAPDAVPTG